MTEIANRTAFDAAKAEAFGSRLLAALNDGPLCLMTSVGHRTGLFDVSDTRPRSRTEGGAPDRVAAEKRDALLDYPAPVIRCTVASGRARRATAARCARRRSTQP